MHSLHRQFESLQVIAFLKLFTDFFSLISKGTKSKILGPIKVVKYINFEKNITLL